jgi:uncharacterized YigZ family protein
MKTVGKETQIEFEERKSKFIGYIKSVKTCREAEEYIKSIKEIHPNATHNCSAYRVFENGQEYYKADDDGEPSGTAGKPMGDILHILEVQNAVVIATRYFGGIKLGAGGLIRNYAKTAKLAVQEAGIVELVEKKLLILDFEYSKVNEIDRILSDSFVIDRSFESRITYRVEVDEETEKKLKNIKDIIIIES